MYIYLKKNLMKTFLTPLDIKNIIDSYKNDTPSIHRLAEKYKIGHKKISKILIENNIEINKKGGQIKNFEDYNNKKTFKYIVSNDKELVAKCKKTNIIINDPNNLSGKLTKHILENYGDVWIPSNSYQRKKYEGKIGKKWFEEYFDIITYDKPSVRKCKLCDWETIDINNKTGCFQQHLKIVHNQNLTNYLNAFPEELIYHSNYVKKTEFLSKKDSYVICNICEKKMKSISNTHLKNKHNITLTDYKLKYPNQKIISNVISEKLSNLAKTTNTNNITNWTSKGELEINDFIVNLGFNVTKSKNNKLLNGKEIDIIVGDTNVCIEYNGLYYHTENMGKKSNYHLNKTIECGQIGYKLYHIFEDEWKLNKNLVKSKIKHILKVNDGIKIGARNVIVKTVSSEDKKYFLNNNHIQGSDKSNISYGAYYNDELVGVMTFNSKRNMTKNKDGEFELSRFSIKQNYIINGLASKFLKQFIKDYSPKTIISFADRRWTPNENNNLYTKLGFNLVSITKPTYCYYNSKINKYKRFHKFGFGKNNLKKRYPNLDFKKTENELMKELGYDRIWDCGLFKFQLDV